MSRCVQVVEGAGSHFQEGHGNIVKHHHLHELSFGDLSVIHRWAIELEIDGEFPTTSSSLGMFGFAVAGFVVVAFVQ